MRKYADRHQQPLEFHIGVKVMLKLTPQKGRGLQQADTSGAGPIVRRTIRGDKAVGHGDLSVEAPKQIEDTST